MMNSLKLAAVIGYPIAHSRSPRLHACFLKQNGIEGYYIPLQIAPADLEACLRLMPSMGFAGANVTIPHKEHALRLADRCTPMARRIGAANTLFFSAEGIEADNTDAHGFTWNILDRLPDWRPNRVAVIGAGGASRAVVAALQDRGATEIRIANRSPGRAQDLAEFFAPGVRAVRWEEREAMLDGCDTLVNASSLGMTGSPALELRLDALPLSAVVNDLVYTPLETDLLARARARGNVAIDGLGMLLFQAVPGFSRWFGVKPTVDQDLRAAVLGAS